MHYFSSLLFVSGEDEDEGFENNDVCSEAKKSKLT